MKPTLNLFSSFNKGAEMRTDNADVTLKCRDRLSTVPPPPTPFHIKNNQEGIEAISFGLLCLEYFRAQRGPELDVIRENTELPE